MPDNQDDEIRQLQERFKQMHIELENRRKESERKMRSDFARLTRRLKTGGAAGVTINFDGSGDSGSIYEILVEDGERDLSDELRQQVEDWAYLLLDSTNIDWYNNDGGYGSIFIDVDERLYRYEIYTRYTESQLSGEGTFRVGERSNK